MIARENRISLVMDRKERHFDIRNASEKYQLYRISRGLDALAAAGGSVVRDQ